MADLTISASDVKLVSGPTKSRLAAAAVAAGQICYQASATKKAGLADNDSATAEVRSIDGLALNSAAADQPIELAANGAVVTVGAVLTAGVDYYLSGTPGGICPRADVTTGDDPIRVGMALTTANLQLDFNDPGVTL
jgi:hypothetical protein